VHTPEQLQSIGLFLASGVENEFKTTQKVLAAVPQDKLNFKLGDKGRTAQELMWHIVESELWFLDGIAKGEFAASDSRGPAPSTVQAIVDQYTGAFPAGLAKVKALSAAQMAKPINFYNIFNMPAGMYLSFLSSHSIHHRGQLSAYIRAMNAKVPSIYGGSADEPFQMPAGA